MNKIEKRPVSIGGKLLKIIACSVFFVVFSVFQSNLAFAAEGVPTVTISVNDKGETIILSDGEILDISAGDGWRTFNLSSGVKIAAFIDPVTCAASIKCYTGTVEMTSGGQTVTVHQGESTTASPGEGPTSPITPPTPAPAPPTPPKPPEPPPEPPHSPSS
ncbi:MAG: hypothetical protein U9N58_02835 [Thermodesulfobacteriota bacterium]|nr:hypothetical protein [Thermodesulfobacteriota bacterium]